MEHDKGEHHKSHGHQAHHVHHEHHNVHHGKKKLSTSFYKKIIILLASAILILTLYNTIQVSLLSSSFEKELIAAKESTRPAEIELITIIDSKCKDCFDIQTVVDYVKGHNVNVTKEESLDLKTEKAKELIEEYGIEKIPTVIVLGETSKAAIKDLEENEDALVFTELIPPYTDTKSGNILGMVSSLIIADPTCDKCSDLNNVLDGIKSTGVIISTENTLEKDSKQGQTLIDKYEIKVLPTMILSKDLEVYGEEITNSWNQFGSVEKDGSYITREISPPYLDLSTDKVVGLVSMIILVDKSCTGCYDPNKFHKPILERMGIVFDEEKSVDITSSLGKSLIEKYEIEKVPTILLSGDVGTYPVLIRAWTDVGTAEDDGTYIFRKVEVARQAYKDLVTNKIINPATATS